MDTQTETDLVAAVHRVLAASDEPLTPSKIRARLAAVFRAEGEEKLADCLNRQVAANTLFQYPKYRSPQSRFWDRSMPVHIAALLRRNLQGGPLAWGELQRKLPPYARGQAEAVLRDQLSQGLLHRHPRGRRRGGDRFGIRPADPKEYLRAELAAVFSKLAQLGFNETQLRAGALELLHEEEWSRASGSEAAVSPAHSQLPQPHSMPTRGSWS